MIETGITWNDIFADIASPPDGWQSLRELMVAHACSKSAAVRAIRKARGRGVVIEDRLYRPRNGGHKPVPHYHIKQLPVAVSGSAL